MVPSIALRWRIRRRNSSHQFPPSLLGFMDRSARDVSSVGVQLRRSFQAQRLLFLQRCGQPGVIALEFVEYPVAWLIVEFRMRRRLKSRMRRLASRAKESLAEQDKPKFRFHRFRRLEVFG